MVAPTIEQYHMENDRWTRNHTNFKAIDGVVIHYDAGVTMEGTMNYLLNHVDKSSSKSASYHYLLGDGRVVEFNDPANTRAWHAGRSEYKGMHSLNKNTIGISIRNYGFSNEYDAETNRVVYAPDIGGTFRYWEPYAFQDIDNLI